MASWLLTLGIIFIVIAIVLMLLGFVGRVAWTIGKWLIIIFIILAILSWLFSVI
jgi:multisubunit Na+/H+ antiporter MnhF subunit